MLVQQPRLGEAEALEQGGRAGEPLERVGPDHGGVRALRPVDGRADERGRDPLATRVRVDAQMDQVNRSAMQLAADRADHAAVVPGGEVRDPFHPARELERRRLPRFDELGREAGGLGVADLLVEPADRRDVLVGEPLDHEGAHLLLHRRGGAARCPALLALDPR